ncbi:MAG TPA: hypothetical protein VM778_06300 [Gemmatimonadota bacterium]|nr:hypothetical protein [Gemmatimonadota bacterium]
MRSRRRWSVPVALVLAVGVAAPAHADGFHTATPPMISLGPDAPAGSSVVAIISSGDTLGDFTFEGIPDGIGLMPGAPGEVEVFVSHEQSRVPFLGFADFEDASVSQLTLDTSDAGVLEASVPIGPENGYIRFCSSFMAGPAEGFKTYTFFANEESSDIIDVPPGAPYGPDPAIAPQRQAGYAVVLNAETGAFTQVAGMGRHNHENSVVIPGGWSERGKGKKMGRAGKGAGPQIAILSTDDTFSPPTSQLYLYLANRENHIWQDKGSLWAFQATAKNGSRVNPRNAFNGANDYLDLDPGDTIKGRFIRVPKRIARGTTALPPQEALERWSNRHNAFQFIRLEDLAYDRHNPRVVYIADTGATRVVPDPTTGRMVRGPSGTVGEADNGRIFKMVMNAGNPRKVNSLTVYADGDWEGTDVFVPMRAPDNIDTSEESLMVQEDTSNAKVWAHDFDTGSWTHVLSVNDPQGESSGIVDASAFFGEGAWLLDVQAHGSFESSEVIDGVTYKREDGQLLLVVLPGTT